MFPGTRSLTPSRCRVVYKSTVVLKGYPVWKGTLPSGIQFFVTTLSGASGSVRNFHVVTSVRVDSSAVLDGFTITCGRPARPWRRAVQQQRQPNLRKPGFFKKLWDEWRRRNVHVR